jgi:CDP-paratose 2-epimerase
MNVQHILLTGGAGFVGSNLALLFRTTFPEVAVSVFDNLHRRGSELNLPRLREAGVAFYHGDVRCREDLSELPAFDLLIDCAAEPSVQAGTSGSPDYVLSNNLAGTILCMEAARTRGAAFLFLSTSRVYPIAAINGLPYREEMSRFAWTEAPAVPGFSEHGIAEGFPLEGPRSFYGASKLAAELVLQEYVYHAGLKAIIDRCGILAGPWQMGKVDQGVVALWVAHHCFGKPLKYIGFGGAGKQVRDLLHVRDLFALLVRQIAEVAQWRGEIYNVGGGMTQACSLAELTETCQSVTGRRIAIGSAAATHPADVRIYVTDSRRVRQRFGWQPVYGTAEIVADVFSWIQAHRDALEPLLTR